ncbi:MAG TPA: discoidin domain-containing protein [bacterium]|nr:discoidin domain-containing protein [bacterium]
MILAQLFGDVFAGEKASGLNFSCRSDNDLYQALVDGGALYPRFDTPMAAVEAAEVGSGVLILADEYPAKPTAVETALFDAAAKKKLRLYVEYPSSLPDIPIGESKEDRLLRGVVLSNIFGESLPPMRIVGVNGCRYMPMKAENPHLVLARVAGVGTAVFGLADTQAEPLLFDHPRGDVLVSTSKLSNFVTGRFMPDDAWLTIWQTILRRLRPDSAEVSLSWTPTVRPSYGRDEPLPEDVELQALRRSTDWLTKNRMLRHSAWPKQMLDWSLRYNTVRDMPGPDCPEGDGSLGILEGFSSTIRADGSQPMRYAVRTDCMSETAMQLVLDEAVTNRPEAERKTLLRIAANLNDYIFGKSGLANVHRLNPEHPAYGLVGWEMDTPDGYWGDDNARSILGMLAVSCLRKENRWNDSIAKVLLGNFRITGVYGYRVECLQNFHLERDGWKHHWQGDHVKYSPHMEAWLWPCFLWAYEKTRFEPFLSRTETGARMLVEAYPKWFWVNRSGAIERARAILPLAWLVRVKDTPQHRRWLRKIAEDLIALQDSSGAIRETIGDGGHGTPSNASYGTEETSLIQTNDDSVSDMLYTCNFALIGLHEAAAATGDKFYADAEDKLAKFLCRIQIRSEKHPELDGAWYRAFNFRNWDYWASNSDWEWGPWCTETGWTQPWIAGTLALRRMKSSLWDLAKRVELGGSFDEIRRQFLSDEAIKKAPNVRIRHAAIDKPITLSSPADARYPGNGLCSLANGLSGVEKFTSPGWMRFEGTDFEATVDLEDTVPISEIAVGFLQSTAEGVYLPARVEFGVSEDGKDYRLLATVEPNVVPQEPGPLRKTLSAEKLNVRARYVRIRAFNLGTVPAGLPSAGSKAWLFVDEIMVNPDPS